MKKSILLIAAALFTLGMTSCTDEPIVNPNNNVTPEVSNPRVKTTADLIGTNWTYTMDSQVAVDPYGDTITIPSLGDLFYLNFDSLYAHFTFSDMVEAWGLDANDMMQQITGIDFEYSYDGTTHTGTLNGEDEEGNPAYLTFTYSDANDEITFIIPMAFDGDTTSMDVPVVFHRTI